MKRTWKFVMKICGLGSDPWDSRGQSADHGVTNFTKLAKSNITCPANFDNVLSRTVQLNSTECQAKLKRYLHKLDGSSTNPLEVCSYKRFSHQLGITFSFLY